MAAVVAVLAGLTTTAAPAVAQTSHTVAVAHHDAARHHACTRTSSGTCIRGGEFCPQSKWHKSGWDARGRRYVCKGNRTHPHWMVP